MRLEQTTPVVEMVFGSRLYGTATPESDFDLKAVFVPPAREILLQRIAGGAGGVGEAGVDREAFALHRYLGLLAEGQTIALDMLFAPGWAMAREPSPLWREIAANSHRLVGRNVGAFVGYCRGQAKKYGAKGSRLRAARAAVEWLDEAIARLGARARLAEAADGLPALLAGIEHTAVVEVPHPGGIGVSAAAFGEAETAMRREAPGLPHLECCGRKVPFSAPLEQARGTWARLLEDYGERAGRAEREGGADWKALSHAVRVGREALELLETGRITFPLRDAARILAIKQGRVPHEEAAAEIEGLLEAVEAAQARSSLPERPDRAFMDEIVLHAYGDAVRRSWSPADRTVPVADLDPSGETPDFVVPPRR